MWWDPNIPCDGIWRQVFVGGGKRSSRWSPLAGISALIRKACFFSLSVSSGFCHARTNKPGSRLSPDTRSAEALILYFLVSRNVRRKCLWLKPPNRWCSVTVAQTATMIIIQVDGKNGPPPCLHTLYHVILLGPPTVCGAHAPASWCWVPPWICAGQ